MCLNKLRDSLGFGCAGVHQTVGYVSGRAVKGTCDREAVTQQRDGQGKIEIRLLPSRED